ncbi:MAG: FAD:protein FMN transferase [Chloroherpetonaceae bacterium]|nr:FAD:protein FMN transferase [Chthonomonadaceae bacterium]MDW8207156.1 FAD:protein FMN transferase [Chloroherpetonaceae bacterium]
MKESERGDFLARFRILSALERDLMSLPEQATLALRAMGTRFELVLFGKSEPYLRATGEEALAEIARVEAQLSLYRSDSDLTDLNLRASEEPVPVDPRFFHVLARARTLWEETEGAFDPTVGPLMRCWGLVRGGGRVPDEAEIAAARAVVGMQHVVLDPEHFTVRFDRSGVQLDLGAIGKGYALERAVDILRDNGVESALLHGGTSSVYALGAPPEQPAWKVAIRDPLSEASEPLACVALRDAALSVSAPHGKWFENEGQRYGHVIDPRTGYPARGCLLTALVTESPTDGDALSTALLVQGEAYLDTLMRRRPECRALLVIEEGVKERRVISRGIPLGQEEVLFV